MEKTSVFLTPLNILFIIQLVVVFLVVTGFLLRTAIVYLVLVLAVFVIFVPINEGLIFFVRSIPLFVAIPITQNFDSLNTWRLISIIIFLKWLSGSQTFYRLPRQIKDFAGSPITFLKEHRIFSLTFIFLLLAVLSLSQAQSVAVGIKRIIYFINLSLVGIVLYQQIGNDPDFSKRVIKNISVPLIIVALAGMAQLALTYFMDIYQFFDFWAGTVDRGLFGNAWAEIALKANTWFAYFGNQLSLRMFSIFPDSHSFPIFLLLGLPALFALSFERLFKKNIVDFWVLIKTRSRLIVIFVPIIFLAMILSGTRGIWLASVGAAGTAICISYILRNKEIDQVRKIFFRYFTSYLLIFLLLFLLAYPIFASDQFQISKENSLILKNRVRSILDLGETSNKQRIIIWKASIKSIGRRPVLGVGIGNFPVVLGQDIALGKAGSSAHNLYLNIAAEMGVLALLAWLYFMWFLMKKAYQNFTKIDDPFILIYNGAGLIFIPWVLFYSLTDFALFDERAFLLFVTTVSLILGIKINRSHQTNL